MTKAREIAELGQKLTVDASGNIDVAGIVTADQLTVEGDTKIRTDGNNMLSLVDTSVSFRPTIRFMKDDGGGETALHMIRDNDGPLGIYRGGTNILQAEFEANGDVSFFENTGTSAKFYWDSSAGTLGIGTDAPNTGSQLHVDGGSGEGSFRIEGDTNTKISQFASTTGSNFLYFGDTDSYNSGQIRYAHSNDTMTLKATGTIVFQTGVSERLRITSDGEVHINNGDISTGSGTNKALLQVANIDTTSDWSAINTGTNQYASTANEIAVLNTANQDLNGFAGIFLQAGENSNGSSINAARIGAIKTSTSGTSTDLAFATRNSSAQMVEHVRIKSDGKVGIGTDSPTAVLHVDMGSNTSDAAGVLIETTNTSNATGPDLALRRIDTNPLDLDNIGSINFYGSNNAAEDVRYARMYAETRDVSNGTEDGSIRFHVMKGGSDVGILNITSVNMGNNAGAVGINTGDANPSAALEVRGDQPYIDIRDNRTGQWDQDDTFSGIRFRTADPDVGGAGQVHAFIKAKHTRAGTGHNNPDAGLVFATSTGVDPAPTERMRITEDGFVGINETNPTAPLHITRNDNSDLIMLECTDGDGAEGPQLHMYRNSASPAGGDALSVIKYKGNNSDGTSVNFVELGAFATGVAAGAENAQYRVLILKNGSQVNAFEVSSSEVTVNEGSQDINFRVESNGNANMLKVDGGTNSVHIGSGSEINSTSTALNVTGSGRALDVYRSTATASNNVINVWSNYGGTKTTNAVIDVDGDMENTNNRYTGFSDQRFKQDIVDATSQWDDIKALQVRKYRFINLVEQLGDDAPVHLGVIAQELEASGMGGLVKTKPVDEDNPDAGDRKSVAYSVLYMKAVKALQEAMERIETLETQRADLETRLAALEGA